MEPEALATVHRRLDDIAQCQLAWTATLDHLIDAVRDMRDTAARLESVGRTLTGAVAELHEVVRHLPCREPSRDTWPAAAPYCEHDTT